MTAATDGRTAAVYATPRNSLPQGTRLLHGVKSNEAPLSTVSQNPIIRNATQSSTAAIHHALTAKLLRAPSCLLQSRDFTRPITGHVK
jgi:hypothetical protein